MVADLKHGNQAGTALGLGVVGPGVLWSNPRQLYANVYYIYTRPPTLLALICLAIGAS